VIAQTKTIDPSLHAEWLLIALALCASALFLYPGWPLAMVSGAICLVGGINRWNWLFYVLVFFLPIAPPLKSDLPFEDIFSILRILAGMGVFIGYALRREGLNRWVFRSKQSLIIILYLLVLAISAAKNGISHEAHRCLFHLCSYVVFYFGVLAWLQNSSQLRNLVHSLIISSIPVALFAFYQFLSGGYTDLYFYLYPDQVSEMKFWDGRVPSVLNYSNSLGGFMAIMSAFALAVAVLGETPAWSRAGKIIFGLCAVTVLFSQSRGAIAGFLAVVILGVVSFARGWKLRVALMVGTVILLLTLMPLLANFSQHLTVKAEDVSFLGRMIVFASAGQLFLKSPIIGVGYGNFRHLMDFDLLDLQANNWDAHNLGLQLLAESGILGFVTFGGLLLIALWSARRMFRQQRPFPRLLGFAAFAAIISVLVHGTVDYLFNVSPQCGTLFWLVLAMVAACRGMRIEGSAVPNALVQSA